MDRIRIGIIGAGCVTQIEHLPNLLALADRFQLVAVADPSPRVRAFITGHWGIQTVASIDQLLSMPLDAVVVASPDALHREHVLAAFGAGLHVLCEKPLCYGDTDISELIAARDHAGRVLQVGYMKRFDPAYETMLRLMPDNGDGLRQVMVEVLDPDAAPFIRHQPWCRGDDLPVDMAAALLEKQLAQVARAVSTPLDATGYRGFCNAYCSSIVHDVNAVHGLVDRLGLTADRVVGAQIFAGGDGGAGTVELCGGAALWTMSHLTVPRLPEYSERITLVFEDASFELLFPSPWLAHFPTRLTVRRAHGQDTRTESIACGFAEAFVVEMKGFHSAILGTAAVRNTAEVAARDMRLLGRMAEFYATRTAPGEPKRIPA